MLSSIARRLRFCYESGLSGGLTTMRTMSPLKTTGLVVAILLTASATARAQNNNPFDAVFAIMTQPRGPDSTGCRGCHITEDPADAIFPYFGNTQCEVEYTLITFGDGELIFGGRQSVLASLLREGFMPQGGYPWNDDQLEALYLWLDTVAPSDP